MKFYKYRCSTCGKIWYEEEISDNEELSHNIHHGCPDGCDDTGEYLGYADLYKHEWCRIKQMLMDEHLIKD